MLIAERPSRAADDRPLFARSTTTLCPKVIVKATFAIVPTTPYDHAKKSRLPQSSRLSSGSHGASGTAGPRCASRSAHSTQNVLPSSARASSLQTKLPQRSHVPVIGSLSCSGQFTGDSSPQHDGDDDRGRVRAADHREDDPSDRLTAAANGRTRVRV